MYDKKYHDVVKCNSFLYAFNHNVRSTCNLCVAVDQPFALRLLVSVMSYELRCPR